ncbi:MAG: S41 family peptidase, partial [Pseudomonadota bacterium]
EFAEKFYGADGQDYFDSNDGDDFIYGGDGNDTIILSQGNNQIDGGNGVDTLILEEPLENFTITAGNAADHFTLTSSNGKSTIRGIEWFQVADTGSLSLYEFFDSMQYVPGELSPDPFNTKVPDYLISELNSTNDPSIYWAVIEHSKNKQSIGYLRLASMNPHVSISDSLLTVSQVLRDSLSGTDRLIIDVRDNAGGLIPYAEALVQLFTREPVNPLTYRMTPSALNHEVFVVQERFGAKWREAYLTVDTNNEKYTGSNYITHPTWTNEWVGQVYFRPVGLFLNSRCLSACESFVSLMQNYGKVAITGTDEFTGGAFANVISFSEKVIDEWRLHESSELGFKPLPGAQDILMPWRQAIDMNLYNGTLESQGVKNANPIDALFSDTINNFDFKQVLENVFDIHEAWTLENIKASYDASVYVEHDFWKSTLLDEQHFIGYQLVVPNQSSLEMKIRTTATAYVDAFRGSDKIATVQIPQHSDETNTTSDAVDVTIPIPNTGVPQVVTLKGYFEDGSLAWRVIRLVSTQVDIDQNPSATLSHDEPTNNAIEIPQAFDAELDILPLDNGLYSVSVDLTWQVNQDVTHFQLQQIDLNVLNSQWTPIWTGTSITYQKVFGELLPDQEEHHQYRLRACRQAECGPWQLSPTVKFSGDGSGEKTCPQGHEYLCQSNSQ